MAIPASIEYLISAQHESGGWGYKTGHQPVVEATAAVLLAIRDEAHARAAFQRGLSWLLGCQHQDGGWGINELDPESGWQTAWALIVINQSAQNSEGKSRAVQWLSSVSTYAVPSEEFLTAPFPKRDSLDALVWPWLPGQAGWLEPTALAIIALNGVTDVPLVTSRIKIALDYLSRYRTPDGGWNIGNASPLDTLVIPRAYPTTLVLVALASAAPQDILRDDFIALQQDLERDQGMLAHAASLFAMKLLGKNGDTSTSYLSANQLSDGSWEHNPFVTAWSILALRGYL